MRRGARAGHRVTPPVTHTCRGSTGGWCVFSGMVPSVLGRPGDAGLGGHRVTALDAVIVTTVYGGLATRVHGTILPLQFLVSFWNDFCHLSTRNINTAPNNNTMHNCPTM